MTDYDHRSIETKWQRTWEEQRCFETLSTPPGRRFYCLEMLPYPSGRIHMGHVRNYAIGDAVARFKWMRGFDVMHPMGWDSFGMPAENAAIKQGMHPKAWTESNIADMRGQLKSLGFAYDWSREIASHEPGYYRWNQWFFIRMFEKGLAYRSLRRVNWCPQCATVLANEQVEQGGCWRCQTPVVHKDLDQWFLKTSAYAEELLRNIETLAGWPERVRLMQRNWIGRSEGTWVQFPVKEPAEISPIKVFTTRIDTIFGATFLALAGDHAAVAPLVESSPEREAVERFLADQRKAPVGEKLTVDREKAGVFTGRFALNLFSGERIPIWIANFVLMEYGTGAIMAVPAHDERDHEFATRYGLPIKPVIAMPDGLPGQPPYTSEEGVTVDSGSFSGLGCEEAKRRMTRHAEEGRFGEGAIQFRLRDWGISRQRYWGTPIPMLHCSRCGVVPVPDADLPVVLPQDVQLTGKGGSPLQTAADFLEARCPKCRGPARRDTDTMDTFMDSSWYFYRYLDPRNVSSPFDPEVARAWFPIDLYIGGITHAILHLLYARFFSMVMRDLGLQTPAEPVTRLLCQGMVLKGGFAMSKSRGNVVAPDEMIERYGADVTRLFTLFASPPERDLDWSDAGIEGLYRFARRVWRFVDVHADSARTAALPAAGSRPRSDAALDLRRKTHQTLERVADDIDRRLHLNTAIAAIMELVNALYLFAPPDDGDRPSRSSDEERGVLREALETLAICLAPFAPHLAEETWARLGHDDLLAKHLWPDADPAMLEREDVVVIVQVNGKLRGRVTVRSGEDEEGVVEAVRRDAKLAAVVFPDAGSRVVRTVYVPGKLLNVVQAR